MSDLDNKTLSPLEETAAPEERDDSKDYTTPKRSRANIVAAIFCLLLATVLWGFVIQSRNPNITKTFECLPIAVRGVPEGYQAALSMDRVTLTLSGSREQLDDLADDQVAVYVDCSALSGTAGSYTLPLLADLPSGVALNAALGFVQVEIAQEPAAGEGAGT